MAFIPTQFNNENPDTASVSSVSSVSVAPIGQAFYGFGSGAYTWTCPPGVTSVSVGCIGGGASNQGVSWSSQAGGGGGLGWKNNIAVVPGQTYAVQVGKGGDLDSGGGSAGGQSFFITSGTVRGVGGSGTTGGGYTGDGGGNGGNGGQYGGGGAGGYTGNGGGENAAGSGGGGSGGGSYSSTYGGASGGGTGPFGQGSSGAAASSGAAGKGGSGGEDGMMGENAWYSLGFVMRTGGLYGGGGGGTGTTQWGGSGISRGGRGCVRIIWGDNRSFPSTGTGDM